MHSFNTFPIQYIFVYIFLISFYCIYSKFSCAPKVLSGGVCWACSRYLYIQWNCIYFTQNNKTLSHQQTTPLMFSRVELSGLSGITCSIISSWQVALLLCIHPALIRAMSHLFPCKSVTSLPKCSQGNLFQFHQFVFKCICIIGWDVSGFSEQLWGIPAPARETSFIKSTWNGLLSVNYCTLLCHIKWDVMGRSRDLWWVGEGFEEASGRGHAGHYYGHAGQELQTDACRCGGDFSFSDHLLSVTDLSFRRRFLSTD